MPARRAHHQSDRRDGASLAFGFFLSLSLVSVALLMVVRVVPLGRHALRSLFNDDGYCAQVVDYATETAGYYTIPTGLDASVLAGVFSEDDVHRSGDAAVAYVCDGTSYAPDVSRAAERLLTNTTHDLLERDVAVTGEADEAAQAYVDEVMDIYRASMRPPGLDELAGAYRSWVRYLTVGIIALVLLSAGLVFAITRLHHYPHRSIRFVGVAFVGAALMCLVAPGVTYLVKPYLGIGVTPQHVYHLCVSLIERALLACMALAAIYALTAAALLIVSVRMRRQALRSGLKKHRARV